MDSVGALFTYGVALDWKAIDRPNVRRRLSLPTYPFERRRYWFASPPEPAQRGAQAVGVGAGQVGHKLQLRRLRSPGLRDIVYETEIGRHDPVWLAHHSIFDVVILPSPAYLEMALSAAAELFPLQACAVVNFTIHTPLLLPEEGLRTVQLLIKQGQGAAQQADGGAHSFQVLAWDKAADDWTLHASGDLQPAGALGAVAPFQLHELQGRCRQEVSGAAYYEQVRALGLTFGESFQGIRQVWIGDGEALGRIELPQALVADADLYRFHPALLDACFHLLGAPLAKNGMDAAYLLIGIERFELHRVPGSALWNHTRIVPHTGPGIGPAGAGETFTGDIFLYDDEGRLVAEAHGLQLKRADRATLMRAVGRRPQDWTYAVEWQPQPLDQSRDHKSVGAQEQSQPQSPHTWLIIDGSEGAGGVGDRLAHLLTTRGHQTMLRRHRGEIDQSWTVGAVHGVVFVARVDDHLPTASAPAVPAAAESPAGESESRMTTALLHLVQALAQRAQPLPGGLWIATQGAQPAVTPPTAAGLRQSPLWGVGRVVALEQPQLWGGLVDLDASDEQAAQQLLAEIESGDGEDQVAWRGGERMVARLQRVARPAAQTFRLRGDRSYLITGGLGGLGLETARRLAQQGAGQLLLMGRRGLTTGPAAHAVAEIERLGTTVTIIAADVADEESMAALFARFGADLPPLAGIIHTAADLSNAPVVALDEARVRSMLRPKVQGTWNLHRLSENMALDFFVLFSSTTALLGANGLAHYAAANVYLDSFAHYRRSLGLPALSVNWGTWSVMRAASDAEQQRVAEFGLEQMPAAQALDLLGDFLLQPPTPQVMAAAVNWDALKPAYEARRRRPLLARMAVAPANVPAGAALPSAAFVEAEQRQAPVLVVAWRSAPPDDRRDILIAALRAAVAKIIGMADPAAIDLHQGLFEMGMDSLMSVELKTRLERQVGRSLPSTLTFNYPTIDDLAGYLEQQVLALPPTEPSAEPSASVSGAKNVEQVTDDGSVRVSSDENGRGIDDLSEDELAQRLMERLSRLT